MISKSETRKAFRIFQLLIKYYVKYNCEEEREDILGETETKMSAYAWPGQRQ